MIPGLSEEARKKAVKSAEKKKKVAAEKERKKKKKEETSKFRLGKDDFLDKSKSEPVQVDLQEFEFSDYSSDEHEVFEDSKEDVSEEEYMTPIHFKSNFGRKHAALSTSTPDLSLPTKRSRSSPGCEVNPNVKKNKSMLPIKKLKRRL